MVDIVEVKKNNVKVYPQTHVQAVIGIEEDPRLKGPKGDQGDRGDPGIPGVKGDQGDPGKDGTNATTTSVATPTSNGLMSKEMVIKLNSLEVITLSKVGSV